MCIAAHVDTAYVDFFESPEPSEKEIALALGLRTERLKVLLPSRLTLRINHRR